MEENDNQELDLEAEELAIEPDEQPTENEMVAKKDYLTEIARKKHWREKAVDQTTGKTYKQLWEEASKPKEQLQPKVEPKVEPTDELKKTVDRLNLSEKKRDFGDEHGLTKAEVDEVFAYASGKGVEPVALMKDKDKYPGLTAMLSAVKSQRRAADNTPMPSSDVPTFQGKKFNELDEKGRRENWGKAVEAIQSRNK